ncbi:MAG: glucosidase [Gemmataceae bacterium]|nr:glucosidase [Gemmataceae bacterium]
MTTREHERLLTIRDDNTGWRRWGPYVGDRSWATVREDYSADGNAWDFLPHDLARSKAYRWGEDGIAGLCDRYQLLVFAPAFWNGKDPILKERLFGLTPAEGNHGEDVKEYYFHLDNTPTHSYMKLLYKYPQAEFPYGRLVEENRRRRGQGFEYELLDTGVFHEDRYFDIFIEYAKATEEDICVRIEAVNRGPEPAPLHILPHLWFRNTWSWCGTPGPEPHIQPGPDGQGFVCLVTDDSNVETLSNIPIQYRLGPRTLYGARDGRALFTNNETNVKRVFGATVRTPYVKDAFHDTVVRGIDRTNPARTGTKSALHYVFPAVPPGGSVVVRLRLSGEGNLPRPLEEVDGIIALRKQEADEFYESIYPVGASSDERLVQRQALAGLLWTKQSYLFDVHKWLDGDSPDWPPPESRKHIRNEHWRHLNSMRVMTLPDKWEYPWFAAWDLAFHCIVFALVDPAYAKDQLWVLLFEQFQHPNGQLPAYEWEFSDLNPPVHPWAVWRVYNMDRIRSGKADREFLERCFHKLLINFAWWINKVDREGNNIFEGGFLGLDNITVVDRSMRCQDGSVLEQADATGWMGMFCLNMMRIALELAKENHVYEGLAVKFFQHYAYVAAAMKHMGRRDFALWDEQDGFFYDVLRFPDGGFKKFRVRSLVGLIPLFAVERLEVDWIQPFREFTSCVNWFLRNRKDLVEKVVHTVEHNGKVTHALTIVNQDQLVRLMDRLWDPGEFLSDYGIRSLAKTHQKEPFEYDGRVVGYEPAEAVAKIKGGNSNWRGPIWFPTCFLLIESLRKLGKAFGASFTVSPPTAGGRALTFAEMASEIANRLIRIFTRDDSGRRAVYGGTRKFQEDPHWRDLVLFYEYFHGDNGAGLGASHQTGWTALVASLIDEWRTGARKPARSARPVAAST